MNPADQRRWGQDPEREEVAGDTPSGGASSRVRDHLANERTLLAYLRTGVSILALGLVIERFSLFQRLTGVPQHNGSAMTIPIVGTVLMWLGFLLIPLSVWRFLVERRGIGPPYLAAPLWPLTLLALTLALASIVLLAAVLLDRWA